MHLNSFRFDASLVREFIEFGRALYVDDARWIPPLRRTVRDADGTAVGLVGFFECVEDPILATRPGSCTT